MLEVIWYIVGYQEVTVLAMNLSEFCTELPGIFWGTHYHKVKPKSGEKCGNWHLRINYNWIE